MSKKIILLFMLPTLLYSQWVKQVSNTTETLNNTHFVNNSIGFAVGNNGTIIKTTDGGTNWTNI